MRDKVWFDISHEGETDYNIIKELPEGADTNRLWRIADLGRLRMNLTPGNVLTANGVLNLQDSQNSGISPFDPVSVSVHNHNYLYIAGLKDQITIARDTLLEFGGAFHRNKASTLPQGDLPYILDPGGRTGNYFVTNENISTRTQAFAICFCVRGSLQGRTSSQWVDAKTAFCTMRRSIEEQSSLWMATALWCGRSLSQTRLALA